MREQTIKKFRAEIASLKERNRLMRQKVFQTFEIEQGKEQRNTTDESIAKNDQMIKMYVELLGEFGQ